ncbi:transcription factor 7-like 1 [Xenentodon cancila]
MSRAGDLGARDELIRFRDEGGRDDQRNVSAERDLGDVKTSLVQESETPNGSDSEVYQRHEPHPGRKTRTRTEQLVQDVFRNPPDAGLFQPSTYVRYPVFMLSELGHLYSPCLSNVDLTTSGCTFLPLQWPLLDVPGTAPLGRSHLPPYITPLPPLLPHSPKVFSPQRISPGLSPDTGVSRTPPICYQVSPGGVAQIGRTLGWIPGQSMYLLTEGLTPSVLTMNTSVTTSTSSLPVVLTDSSILHPTPIARVKREPGNGGSQLGKSTRGCHDNGEEKPHIKKPLNAFMLFMREERPVVVEQCKIKESSTINQILGQRWHSLSKEEQCRFYNLARKERLLHSKLYPNWSARDNYGKRKKRKRGDGQPEGKSRVGL